MLENDKAGAQELGSPRGGGWAQSVISGVESLIPRIRRRNQWKDHCLKFKGDRSAVIEYLKAGAESCRLWELSEGTLQPLVDLVVGGEEYISRVNSVADMNLHSSKAVALKIDRSLMGMVLVINSICFLYGSIQLFTGNESIHNRTWSIFAKSSAMGTVLWTSI